MPVCTRFAEAVHRVPRPLPRAVAQALSDLLARRQRVTAVPVSVQRRLPPTLGAMRSQVGSLTAWLRQKRDDLARELRRQIRQRAGWRKDGDLLQSVPGVGPVVATTLIAFFSMRRFVWS